MNPKSKLSAVNDAVHNCKACYNKLMAVGCKKDLGYLIFSFTIKNRNNSLELLQPHKIYTRGIPSWSKLYIYIILCI